MRQADIERRRRQPGGISTVDEIELFALRERLGAVPAAVRNPRWIVIAGPNGARNALFAREYPPRDAGSIQAIIADLRVTATHRVWASDATAAQSRTLMRPTSIVPPDVMNRCSTGNGLFVRQESAGGPRCDCARGVG
jgi:hypothetical protein